MGTGRKISYAQWVTRLYAWLQRHPTLVDGVMAAILVAFGAATTRLSISPFQVLAHIAIGLPILVRRRYPVGAFVAVTVVGALQVLARSSPSLSDFAVPMVIYALAAYRKRSISLSGLAIGMVGAFVALVQWTGTRHNPAAFELATQWIFAYGVLVAPLVIAWVLGDSMKYRRAYYLDLEDKTRRLERERDQQFQIIAAAERARIARELHDVVAHNVSVMVVQAEGASYALDSSPEATRQALGAIADTGRAALSEMRRLLGVLRAEDGGVDRTPQPGVDQLEDLLEQVRAAGVPVEFTVEGVPVPLPQGMELAAYRIVQESLTNTRKHGGLGVSARVALHYGETELRMMVSDSGLGVAALTDGKGNGLIGMRERVAMYGGALVAGPGRGGSGGFEVEAILPYRAVPTPMSVQMVTPVPVPVPVAVTVAVPMSEVAG
jgi:signal transduction histidine kinase